MPTRLFALLITALAAFGQSSEARARKFLDLLSNQDAAASELLDAQLKTALPPEKLQQIWKSLTAQMGAFKKFGDARVESWDGSDLVFVACEFEKQKLDARIPINKAGLVSGFNLVVHSEYTPPEYVKPASFHEKDVVVGTGEWAVHGTLTVPNGTGPFPALILVQGSGPTDRDYTLGPNKLFRDIAWGVGSRGIAVLRYNKRTYEHAVAFSKLPSSTANEESVDDAVAAAAMLRTLPEIDPKRIFLLGHSLGGTLAPRIGKADPSLAGLIIAAGAAIPFLDLIVPQTIHELTINGPMNAAAEKQLEQIKKQVARAHDPNLKPDTPSSEMPLGAPAAYWIDIRDYHPDQLARELKQPMLILACGRDYQVTGDDLALWKKALSDRPNVQFKTYPKLNHIFLEGEGVSSPAEYQKPGHVPAVVINDIATWITTLRTI